MCFYSFGCQKFKIKASVWPCSLQISKRESFLASLFLNFYLFLKDSDAGRDWGQEEKGTTEDEMAGWYHWLNGRESEWTPGVDDGQGGLECCDSWGRKESDTTEQLNWTELNYFTVLWWFLPHIHMNQPWVYMCFPSWPSLLPPSPSRCLKEKGLSFYRK